MALPAGVTTVPVIAGVPVTHTGAAVKAFVSIEPSAFLVHAATGTPLVDFLEELDISEGTSGQFILPHTDQAGFEDGAGNAYTNWYYTARITYSTPSKAKTKAPKVKVFQLLSGQTDPVDLDKLPEGAPALPYSAPTAKVDAFMGRTGAVTLLDADLPERLSETELSATFVGSVDAKATYSRINDRGHAVASALKLKLGDVAVGIAGDSTGDLTDEWFYQTLQLIGADDPDLKIAYNEWQDVPQTYGSSTIQAGTSRYVVVKEDVFDRVSADLYGSTATTGGTSWFGNSGGAGDWSVDGTAAVATADTTNAEVTLVVGALTNSRTVAKLEAVSAFAGSMTHDFIVRRSSSVDNLRVRIVYNNVANTYQAALRQTIGGTVTTLVSGSVLAMPGDRKFTITLDIVGLNVTMTVNAATNTATLSQANADILNVGTQQGFQRFSNTAGDKITLFSSQRIDPPRTLTAYNGSRAGSTLDYQQTRLATMYPAPLDLLFVSSAHNYGADTAATYTTKLDEFVQDVFDLHPNTGLIIGSQNPKYTRFSGDQRDAQRARCRAARTYAKAHNYGYLPVMEAFDAEPDGGLSKVQSDSLHPTTGPASGSSLWAAVAKAYLDSLAA